MSTKYILNPYARVAVYANRHFSYDSRVAGAPLIEIPVEPIDEAEFAILELLRTQGFLIEPRSARAIRAYLADNGMDPDILVSLTERRFLKQYSSPAEEVERNVLDYFNRRYRESGTDEHIDAAEAFDKGNDLANFSFTRNTFFNLPTAVDPDQCHVGLLGFPHSSLNASLGTEVGPDHLRLHSRSLSWLDIQKHGAYSEISLDQGKPGVICQGVVVRDCGDLRCEASTLTEMIEHVRTRLTTEFFRPGVYPLIVGGDHAITYPIIRAYLANTPDLGLLHLDAHNDLFYTPHVVYSHAAPISNLVRRTRIERVASFGLRTFTDMRMAGLRAIYDENDADSRIRLRSLTATKQLIMDPLQLEAELQALADRPYYISLDLDVLSEAAIGRQVSTPFGVGLEWHELLTFLVAAFKYLDVIGCDIVEYNGLTGQGRNQYAYYLNSLLLIVIDRLAKGNPKFRAADSITPGTWETRQGGNATSGF